MSEKQVLDAPVRYAPSVRRKETATHQTSVLAVLGKEARASIDHDEIMNGNYGVPGIVTDQDGNFIRDLEPGNTADQGKGNGQPCGKCKSQASVIPADRTGRHWQCNVCGQIYENQD